MPKAWAFKGDKCFLDRFVTAEPFKIAALAVLPETPQIQMHQAMQPQALHAPEIRARIDFQALVTAA